MENGSEDDPFSQLDNESRVYIALHDRMMELLFERKGAQCARLAEDLLTKALLPILIRARCHMMLSRRKRRPDAVEHAEEAVAILDGEEFRGMVPPEAYPQHQLDEALLCLQWARENAATREKRAVQGQQPSTTDECQQSSGDLRQQASADQS